MLLIVLPILKFEDRFEASGFDLAILQRLRALGGLSVENRVLERGGS
jgi:hypothetical protein